MPIRLLALDLDGTLLNSRGEVSARNRQALAQARERGVRVALVTGRRFRDARPLALELGLDVPVISHNGALTKHARTLETVAAILLPLEAARAVVAVGRADGLDAMVSDDHEGLGVLLYDRISEGNTALERYIAWSERIHGEEAAEAVKRVPSLDDYLDHEPVHISFSGGCARMEKLIETLKDELGPKIKAVATMYPKYDFALVDVINPGASKGAGVAAAAAELGHRREEVMAVGDNLNDLEMLDYAGTSVRMGNAQASLQAVERFHATATNDEDGVALAVERFILKQAAGEQLSVKS
jgi:Cof subfamily protein (haloacid dehalogenase superfamily)